MPPPKKYVEAEWWTEFCEQQKLEEVESERPAEHSQCLATLSLRDQQSTVNVFQHSGSESNEISRV